MASSVRQAASNRWSDGPLPRLVLPFSAKLPRSVAARLAVPFWEPRRSDCCAPDSPFATFPSISAQRSVSWPSPRLRLPGPEKKRAASGPGAVGRSRSGVAAPCRRDANQTFRDQMPPELGSFPGDSPGTCPAPLPVKGCRANCRRRRVAQVHPLFPYRRRIRSTRRSHWKTAGPARRAANFECGEWSNSSVVIIGRRAGKLDATGKLFPFAAKHQRRMFAIMIGQECWAK